VGSCVLGGFFLQQFLEFLSSGVEHGHIHVHEQPGHHSGPSSLLVLFALCVHSILEGGLLAHPKTIAHHHESDTLLWGILLHKAPEAFALASVLICEIKNKTRAWFYLILFALASPMGLYLSEVLVSRDWMSSWAFTVLMAVVSGSFLHISTTIVFESSTNHQFNARKMLVALLAAFTAVAAEVMF